MSPICWKRQWLAPYSIHSLNVPGKEEQTRGKKKKKEKDRKLTPPNLSPQFAPPGHRQLPPISPLLIQPEEAPNGIVIRRQRLLSAGPGLLPLDPLRKLDRGAVSATGGFGRLGAALGGRWVAEQATEEGREDGQAGADDADGLLDCGPHGGDDEGVGYVCCDDGGEGCDADDGSDDDAVWCGKEVSKLSSQS